MSAIITKPESANPHSGVVSAALTIAAFTAVVRLASGGKELFVAWRFGTGEDLDAFLISIVVPVAIVSILAGAFSASFIPLYIETNEKEGSEAARSFFYSVMAWALIALLLLAALIVLAAPWYLRLLGSGFTTAKLDFTFKLLCLNSATVVFGGMAALCAAVLNAGRRFAITAAAPLATPLLTLIFLWLIPGWRVYALVGGMVAGAAIEAAVLALALNQVGLQLRLSWPRMDPKMRRLAGQFFPVMSGSILGNGNTLIDQAMAAMLAAGSVAALNYGNRVVQFPLGLAAGALGTALMPHLSQLAAAGNWWELNRTVRRYIKLTFLFTLPLTVGLFFFSRPIVSLLFHRGAFTGNDAQLVAQVQSYYALQIPFYLMGIVVVRLISAVQRNRLLLWASAINLMINITLNYLLMRWIGLAGIAISTSLVYVFSSTFCYVACMREISRRMNVDGEC